MLNSKCTKRYIANHRLPSAARALISRCIFNAFTKSPRAKKVLLQAFAHKCTPIAIAKKRTMLLPKQDVDAIMELSELSIKQAARGELTHDSFSMLRTAWEIANEIERSGEIRGFSQDLLDADNALNTIYGRCMNAGLWTAKACTSMELAALKNFAALHRFQVQNILLATLQKISSELQRKAKSQGATPEMSVADELVHMRKQYDGFTLHIPRLVAA